MFKLILPNFNNHGFQQQKKGYEQKHTVSTRQEIRFHPPPAMKDSLKYMFSLDVKGIFSGRNV